MTQGEVASNWPLLLAAILEASASQVRSWSGRRAFTPLGRGGRSA